jgi:hypothetical protein
VPWIAIILCIGCAVAVLVLLARRSARPDDPDSESDEGGGGGNKRPERPRPSNSGGDPSWWPQFASRPCGRRTPADLERNMTVNVTHLSRRQRPVPHAFRVPVVRELPPRTDVEAGGVW